MYIFIRCPLCVHVGCGRKIEQTLYGSFLIFVMRLNLREPEMCVNKGACMNYL